MKRNEHIKLSEQVELSESELESLKHSLWEIDCPRVTVRSCSTQNPCTFKGSGFLKQIVNHQIIFKFYVNAEKSSQINRTFQLGEKIPDEAYYDLTALDYRGRLWRCERILININRSVSGEFIIQGSIPKINCNGEIPQYVDCKGSSLQIRVFDNINIPCNARTVTTQSVAGGVSSSKFISINSWKFKCCKLNFLLIKEDPNLLIINVSSEEEHINKYLRERVIETLQFILGHPVNWSTSYKRIGHKTDVTLCSPKQRSISSRFQPPLYLAPSWINTEYVE